MKDPVAVWTERREAEFRTSMKWNWPSSRVVIILLLGPYFALTSIIGLMNPHEAPWERVFRGVECFVAGLITAWYLQQWLIARRSSREAGSPLGPATSLSSTPAEGTDSSKFNA